MKRLYALMTIGGSVGIVAAFLEAIQKYQLLENPTKSLTCDLNSAFSCTNVLNAWQSSVFGFPNPLLCVVLFTILTTVGLVGWTGAKLTRGLRLAMQALALFVLGFGLWFTYESIYSISALCILCIFCIAGLIVVNAAWLRINVKDLPFSGRARQLIQSSINKGTDTFGWILLALVIAFAMISRFA